MTELTSESISEYLDAHPEFFIEKPDLMKSLKIPHECGNAISLIEYQMRTLREENRHLNQKMVDLIQVARENDLLMERMHRLTLEILQCTSIEELIPTVQDVLRNKFSVDIVHFRLFQTGNGAEQLGYRATDDAGWEQFQDLIDSSRVNLGAITPDEGEFLFGEDNERVRSCAVLPLKKGKALGLLAIGSFSNERFTRQMGTVYLNQMAVIISQAITNFAAVDQDQASNG